MPRVDSIERRIEQAEGFQVRILRNGSDARGDLELPVHYPLYGRKANDSTTVHEWKEARFRPNFAGLDVQVLNGSGRPVTGQTSLRTVRQSYS